MGDLKGVLLSVWLWDGLPLVGQRDGKPPLSPDVYQTLEGAWRVAQKDETEEGGFHLFAQAMTEETPF